MQVSKQFDPVGHASVPVEFLFPQFQRFRSNRSPTEKDTGFPTKNLAGSTLGDRLPKSKYGSDGSIACMESNQNENRFDFLAGLENESSVSNGLLAHDTSHPLLRCGEKIIGESNLKSAYSKSRVPTSPTHGMPGTPRNVCAVQSRSRLNTSESCSALIQDCRNQNTCSQSKQEGPSAVEELPLTDSLQTELVLSA